jgi:hypothetical protein
MMVGFVEKVAIDTFKVDVFVSMAFKLFTNIEEEFRPEVFARAKDMFNIAFDT